MGLDKVWFGWAWNCLKSTDLSWFQWNLCVSLLMLGVKSMDFAVILFFVQGLFPGFPYEIPKWIYIVHGEDPRKSICCAWGESLWVHGERILKRAYIVHGENPQRSIYCAWGKMGIIYGLPWNPQDGEIWCFIFSSLGLSHSILFIN